MKRPSALAVIRSLFATSTAILCVIGSISPALSIDFSLDGVDDALVWNPTGTSLAIDSSGNRISVPCGAVGDIPLAGKLGAGGNARFAFFRPGPGTSGDTQSSFFTCLLGAAPVRQPLGSAGDTPFAAFDFDGDARDDLATWSPHTGEWQILQSTLGFVSSAFGLPGDIATPCDFDGDTRSDLAVFRPGTGEWFIKRSNDSAVISQPWGLASDIPAAADYDGDGRCDVAVYRAETSSFYVIPSASLGGATVVSFGSESGIPLRADIDGNGTDDFLLLGRDGSILVKTAAVQSTVATITVGLSNARPINVTRPQRAIRNDFNGDGRSDLGVIRELVPGLLYWILAHPSGAAFATEQWGLRGDRLVSRDYDGDLRADLSVTRNISGFLHWLISPSAGGSARIEILGTPLDAPVAGDYDGDGKADLAVVRLSNTGAIEWYVKSSLAAQTFNQSWGLVGDFITTGEFIKPGVQSAVAIRPAQGGYTWFIRDFDGSTVTPVSWGLTGDIPAPADYDGDGRSDFAVVRNINGLLVLFVRTAAGIALEPRTWGLTGDILVPGRYGTAQRDEPAVWRSDSQAFYAIADTTLGSQIVPWGLKDDQVIPTINSYTSSPSTPTPQPPDNSSSEFSCTQTLSPGDGSGGFVHKPISESDGKLVVIIPSRYAGQTDRMELGSQGKIIERGKFVGNKNGNRPHFRFSKAGGSYPSFLVEIAYLKNGNRLCYSIPSPGKRYD